ncbi:two-partner secretion domain-containing protein [Pasteurella testudinis]|uniref:two-partner secretion domain-containing protein n=1 Tax=Pasteurella testudinis TaxID=761 RepID=UPI0040593716
MNKHLYRLIFSKSQQRLVVVSEIATREGKAKGEGGQSVAEGMSRFTLGKGWQLSAANLGLVTALGFLLVTTAAANELQIHADQSAAKNQQAIILQTANGLPQVNIQTPNDKGLSHNKYQQFDVDSKGAILNNSRTEVQTEQGGWVQGNPYLARGEAKVILNEVNSNNPSQLKGYVEVAGKRAEVIIANPSGIHCEGCGTINAGRTTLTTGKVELENGMVKGYHVERGKVTVSGRGMDTSRSDYTDIIARETEVNAGVWAKALKVTTGKNRVSADNQSVQVIHKSKQNGTEQPTQEVRYAVDVSELGGMYAGKIHLVGTEDGLGVRNAGHIGATQGHVQIDSKGQIVNSGFVGAQQDVKVTAKQALENHGTVYAQQGDVQLQSQIQGIKQHGSVIAKGDSQGKGKVRLQAKGKIAQQGETLAESDITYQAKQIETEKTAVLAAGVRFEQTENGERKILNAASENGKNLSLTAEQSAVVQGQNLASGHITVNASDVDIRHSQISANQVSMIATTGEIQADNSSLYSEDTTTLSTPTTLLTQNAHLNAAHFKVQADRLDNTGGSWIQRGTTDFQLLLSESLNNTKGKIVTAGNIKLDVAAFNNLQGTLFSGQNSEISSLNPLNNRQGNIASEHHLRITSETIDNVSGNIGSKQRSANLDILVQIDNRQGEISARQQLSVTVPILDNQEGTLLSGSDSVLNIDALNNQQGFLDAGEDLHIIGRVLDNRHQSQTGSLIQATQKLTLQLDTLLNQGTVTESLTEDGKITQGIIAGTIELQLNNAENQKGGIYAIDHLSMTAAGYLNNQEGILSSLNTASLQGNEVSINNRAGKIHAVNLLEIEATQLSGDGDIKSSGDLNISLKEDFTADTAIYAKGSFNFKTAGHVVNNSVMQAGHQLGLHAQQIENRATGQMSAGDVELIAGKQIINRGLINSLRDDGSSLTLLKADLIDNVGTGRIYGDSIALQAEQLKNHDEVVNGKHAGAVIAARKRLDLGVGTIYNQNDTYVQNMNGSAMIYSEGELLFGRTLDEQNHATGKTDHLYNQSAVIESNGAMGLAIHHIENTNAFYRTEMQTVGEQVRNWHYIVPRDYAEKDLRIAYDLLQMTSGVRGKSQLIWRQQDTVIKPENGDVQSFILPQVNQCQSIANQCDFEPHSYYFPTDPAWGYFNITTEADDTLTRHLVNAKAPVAPIEPVKPVKRGSERRYKRLLAEYEQKKLQYDIDYSVYLSNKEKFDHEIKPYYLQWVEKNKAAFERLSSEIAQHNQKYVAEKRKEYKDYYDIKVDKQIIKEDVVVSSLPGKILSGGNMLFSGSTFLNDKSHVLAGGIMRGLTDKIENKNEEGTRVTEDYGSKIYSREIKNGKTGSGRTKYKRDPIPISNGLLKTEATTIPIYLTKVEQKQVVLEKAVDVFSSDSTLQPNLSVFTPFTMGEEKQSVVKTLNDHVRFIEIDTHLPTSALYKVNPNTQSHILVETDPAFAQYKQWLSSDYMLNTLRHDPNRAHKRLGDGFYEQKLINEQINQLTGYRYLSGYKDNESQYKALMDSGITFANKFNLALGVSLSEAQVAQLTSDIVWLETQQVQLDSGETVSVLAPKVYVLARKGDVDGRGALLSGNRVMTNGAGLVNSGTIAGRELVSLNQENIKNLGGRISSRLTALDASTLSNIGGQIDADKVLQIKVDGDIQHQSTVRNSGVQQSGFERRDTVLDRKATFYVRDPDGKLTLSADNLHVSGADITNQGEGMTLLDVKNNLLLDTVEVGYHEALGGNSDDRRREAVTEAVNSRVSGGGVVQLQAKNLTSEGAHLSAQDKLNVVANNDLMIGTRESNLDFEEYHHTKYRSTFSKGSKTTHSQQTHTEQNGSQLQGKEINLRAGNLHIVGSNLTAENDITILAKDNIQIDASENRYNHHYEEKNKKSGFSASLKNGVATVGYQKARSSTDSTGQSTTLNASLVQATQGNLLIKGGEKVDIAASALVSGGDMTVRGSEVNFTAMTESSERSLQQESKMRGIGVQVMYNPLEVAKQTYQDSMGEQSPQGGNGKSVVGTATAHGIAVAETTLRLMKPVTGFATSQRQSQQQQGSQQRAVVSELNAGGKLTVTADKGSILSEGANFSADGDMAFSATDNIIFDTAQDILRQQGEKQQRGAGYDSSTTLGVIDYRNQQQDSGDIKQAQVSHLSSGGTLTLATEKGDIRFIGSDVVAVGDIDATAGRDLILTTTDEWQRQASNKEGKGIGKAVISDTERFAGFYRNSESTESNELANKGTTLGSLQGRVNLNAGGDYRQTASDVIANNGRVDIVGDSLTFSQATNVQQQRESSRDSKIGAFAKVSSPLIDLVQQTEALVRSDKSNERLNALQSAALAAKGYSTYQGLSDKGYLIKGEVGVGFSQSKSDSARYSESAVGNHLNGAEGVSLTARSGNIDATYTTLTTRDSEGKRTSGGTVEFDAAGKILLNAGVDGYRQQSSQRSSGAQVGVGYSVGGQTGVYAYVEAGYSRSGQQGEGIYHHNSVVDADKVIVKSQGDTTLNGAEVHAKQIQTRIGGDLTINSLQDSEQQRSSGSSVGGRVQVSFGTAWEASANASAQQGSANRQQVNRQSGLFAEEHYDVEANNVHLNGGAITGTQRDKNRLATNQFTFTDIENRSESKAVSASIGVSASSDLNKDENGRVIKNDKGEPERVTDVSPTGGLPMFSRTQDNSTTQATLSEGTIILNKDSSPMKTTAAALGINTDSGKGNAQTEKPKDINITLATQKAMQSAVADISAGVSAYSAQQRKVAEAKKADAAQAMASAQQSGNQAAYEQAVVAYAQADSEAKAWGTGGSYQRAVDTATKVISLAIANGNTTQLTATALSPLANQAIKDATTDENGKVDKTTNLILHGILGAVEAQINGGSALGGAAAAMTGEATADLLAKAIYNKTADQLDERERANISSLSSLTGALAATVTAQADGTATDSTTTLVNAATGKAIAESAVENNYLSKTDWMNYANEIKACGSDANCIQNISDKYEQLDKEKSQQALEACRLGGNSSECQQHQVLAAEGLKYAVQEIYPTAIKGQDKWWIQNRLESTYQDSQKAPSNALLSEEKLAEINELLSRPNAIVTDTKKLGEIVDALIMNTRTDGKGNAYEGIEAIQVYPNIAKLKDKVNYAVFGRDLGVEPVYWELSLLGMGSKGISSTSNIIETGALNLTEKIAGNTISRNVVIGLSSNATLQIASGQSFNWYEFAGAGLSAGITPQMGVKDAIRINMGIAMGVSLASGGEPLNDTGLAGIGTWAGSKMKYPILGTYVSEIIQKIPMFIYGGEQNDKK